MKQRVAKRIMDSLGEHDTGRTSVMVQDYNWASNPAAMRSDKEHEACRSFARLLLKRLKRDKAGKFKENEDGRLICLTDSIWD